MTDARDYRSTVFLPKTDFPMKAGLADKEPALLARWAAMRLYDRLRAARAGAERFILHDGPPYANGDIHMGHAMNKVLKDVVVRSQSMLGKDAPYVPGWDCHGLPIEWKIEELYRAKKLNTSKDDDPAAFRAECRAYAAKWVETQKHEFARLGVLGDWDNPYLTMDFAAEATIVAELLKFAASGQLYRGAKPVMWSPVEKTALAEAEIEYADIVSTQVDVAFPIVSSPIPELVGAYAVIWTTTPWTIPVNRALAYGPEVWYLLFEQPDGPHAGQRFVVARDLENAFLDRTEIGIEGELVGEDESLKDQRAREPFQMVLKGSDLAGTICAHPLAGTHPFFDEPRPMLSGEFVTTEQGTGLVHMAPDHGEDDFLLCKAHGIEPLFVVQGDGTYRADWPLVGGQHVYRVNAPDGPVCAALAERGALLAASADYRHSYPHSWRSHAKLIYRCTPQWFIPMDQIPLSAGEREGPAASSRWEGEGSDAGDGGASQALTPLAPRAESPSPQMGEGKTLREKALGAISNTRWVPERSKNRIAAMVEGRPDWVISRQRAWGVPITLFVDRRSGDYLRDAAVDARIVAAVAAGGADAWWATDPAQFLGPGRDPADYERVGDILDVWFDSGSTHAFVVEARYGEGVRADLYLEGSDQHRGWFQSSLLESCGTRGVAPYKAVLTHGFALDAGGRKMSKSEGNTVDPLAVVETSGADILRLWVVSTNYFDDVRIGKEVLGTQVDAYRKLRNTFRYLLGALDGWDEAERVAHADMPELERWVLHRVAEVDAVVRASVADFDFNPMLTAINAFVNQDLSAFYFDVRKDSLYCDAPAALKRRAYRTVLDQLWHALVRWLAPVLVFTTEEAWLTRFPDDDGSVHLQTYAPVGAGWFDAALGSKWERVRELRRAVTEAIEPLRRAKTIGSSLEALVTINPDGPEYAAIARDPEFVEICIVSDIIVDGSPLPPMLGPTEPTRAHVTVRPSPLPRCDRCWRYLPDVAPATELCGRCTAAVAELSAIAA